jgi:hypothetical protein
MYENLGNFSFFAELESPKRHSYHEKLEENNPYATLMLHWFLAGNYLFYLTLLSYAAEFSASEKH